MAGSQDVPVTTMDAALVERVVRRARLDDKSMNGVVTNASRVFVGQEPKDREGNARGSRPEMIKGGPRRLEDLRGWPAPALLFSIGGDTCDLLRREARRGKCDLAEVVVSATRKYLDDMRST